MTTIKSFTSLEQSKKLAEILPLESADMYYFLDPTPAGNIYHLVVQQIAFGVRTREPEHDKGDIPCWSLAALLSVLPQSEYKNTDLCFGGYEGDKYIPEWFCSYEQQEPFILEICHTDNPVDACYRLIIKLKERNLI